MNVMEGVILMKSYDFEKDMCKYAIKNHKSNCNMLLIIIAINIVPILINIPDIYYGTLSIISAYCMGIMTMSLGYLSQFYYFERMELRTEKEKKHIYEMHELEIEKLKRNGII